MVSQRLIALVVVSLLVQSSLLWPSLQEDHLQSHLLKKDDSTLTRLSCFLRCTHLHCFLNQSLLHTRGSLSSFSVCTEHTRTIVAAHSGKAHMP